MRDEHMGDWLGRELERSDKFAREIERLRAADLRDRRASPRFEDFPTVEAMRAHVEASRAKSRQQRPYAWSEDRVERESFDPAPNEPSADLQRHARRLQTRAFYYLGASSAADALLGFVRHGGPIPIPGAIASCPAPVGAVASSTAARLTDDPRWSRRRRDIAYARCVAIVPPEQLLGDDFYFFKTLDGS